MAAERRLRVCIALGPYPPQFTGHGIQIQRTLPYLRARGIDPIVLAYRLSPGPAAPGEDGDSVHRNLSVGTGIVSTLRRVLQFRRYFARSQRSIDVLQCALLGWEFLLNVPYLKRLGLPVLVEMVLLDGDDPLTISRERLGAIKLDLLRRVDAWVGIAAAFLPRLQTVGIDTGCFRLMYTGVDVGLYRPAAPDARTVIRKRLGIPVDARVAVTVGSVIWRKGIDRVLNAWERAQPKRGRDVLLVVGPLMTGHDVHGPDAAFTHAILRKAANPILLDTVRLVGHSDQVHEYLRAADLFVFLSRREGLGTVILEAMACGLPCIVSPLDGIASEVVTDGRTGFIIMDPDDADDAAEQISRLLNNPTLRCSMGQESRHDSVRRFSLDARADALASLYRELSRVRRFGGA